MLVFSLPPTQRIVDDETQGITEIIRRVLPVGKGQLS